MKGPGCVSYASPMCPRLASHPSPPPALVSYHFCSSKHNALSRDSVVPMLASLVSPFLPAHWGSFQTGKGEPRTRSGADAPASRVRRSPRFPAVTQTHTRCLVSFPLISKFDNILANKCRSIFWWYKNLKVTVEDMYRQAVDSLL
jgi:hypothetical protein